jgi:hypothetical protein
MAGGTPANPATLAKRIPAEELARPSDFKVGG